MGLLDVFGNLFPEFFYPCELFFGTEMFFELNVGGLPGGWVRGIQEVDFELGYVCIFNCWADAVVGYCGQGFKLFLVQGACPDCVDTVGGAELGFPVQVEGGEADFTAEGLAGYDLAGGEIGVAEVFVGGGDVAGLDFFPDAGAAKFDAVEVDAVDGVDFDAAFGTFHLEQGCVPFTALPELEALADTDGA